MRPRKSTTARRIAGIDPRRVCAELAAGKVVIVAGFQGMSATALEGLEDTPSASDVHAAEITTLGRGGSDTTAVALAAQLKADRCQIFTDVRGIYTADPRIATDACQLPVVGYEEMMELAHQGAQVMQVRAVELGWVNLRAEDGRGARHGEIHPAVEALRRAEAEHSRPDPFIAPAGVPEADPAALGAGGLPSLPPGPGLAKT